MQRKKTMRALQLINPSNTILGILLVVVIVGAVYTLTSSVTTGNARARVARPVQVALQPADFGGNKCILTQGACADNSVARPNTIMCCASSGTCAVVNKDETCPGGLSKKDGTVCCNHCGNKLFEREKDEACDTTAQVKCINPITRVIAECTNNCICPPGTITFKIPTDGREGGGSGVPRCGNGQIDHSSEDCDLPDTRIVFDPNDFECVSCKVVRKNMCGAGSAAVCKDRNPGSACQLGGGLIGICAGPPNCACIPPTCGDGIVDFAGGEVCEKPNTKQVNGKTCMSNCRGFVDCYLDAPGGCRDLNIGDQCAGANSQCNNKCECEKCGDTILQPLLGEKCEQSGMTCQVLGRGSNVQCSSDCKKCVCEARSDCAGKESGESCQKGGKTGVCLDSCACATCGDNIAQEPNKEECDGEDLKKCKDEQICSSTCACQDIQPCTGTEPGSKLRDNCPPDKVLVPSAATVQDKTIVTYKVAANDNGKLVMRDITKEITSEVDLFAEGNGQACKTTDIVYDFGKLIQEECKKARGQVTNFLSALMGRCYPPILNCKAASSGCPEGTTSKACTSTDPAFTCKKCCRQENNAENCPDNTNQDGSLQTFLPPGSNGAETGSCCSITFAPA